MICLICHNCGISFERRVSEHKSNLKRGRKIIACSYSCQSKAQMTDKNRVCKQCGEQYYYKSSRQVYCSRNCSALAQVKPKAPKEPTKRGADYDTITLGMLRDRHSTGEFHAKLRGHARAVYKRSGQALRCANCDYSLHVDICHIVDVGTFGPEALVSEVNRIDNLVALDKRCHWEFDHGYLEL